MGSSHAFRQFGDLRTRPADDRGAVAHHDILEMKRGEFLDRCAVLFRVDVVRVRHGPQAGFVVHGVAGDAERTALVEERHVPSGVTRREDDPEAVVQLSVVQENVDGRARVPLDARRTVVHPPAGDEVRFDSRGRHLRRRAVLDRCESSDVIRMGVGDEDRRQVFRFYLDLCEVIEDLPAVRVRGGVDQDEAVVDEQCGRRIGLDDVHPFHEFHRLAGMRSSFVGLFLSRNRLAVAPEHRCTHWVLMSCRRSRGGASFGPHGCPEPRRGGRGQGARDSEGVRPVPHDFGPQAGPTRARGAPPASARRERFRGPRISDGRRAERRLRSDDRRRAQADAPHVPALRRPTGRPVERMEAGSVRPDDRGRQVLGPRLRGHEGQLHHATPRGPSMARRRRSAADQPEVRRRGRGGGREPHFGSFVHANQEILHADGATIEGGDHLHEGTPKIELGCKGILYVEMTSRTAKVDQHSSYAAIAPNPAWRLIHALMTLRDAKGRIKVRGWYKDARRPTARELRYLRASAFKADALKEFWGVSEFVGDGNDFDILRRLIYSPTCTICGFVSGYIEQGTKTVNPAVAKAKIDFRLVPNMKQEKQFAKLRDHLIEKGFGDIELSPAKEALEAAAISLSARVVKAAIKGSVDAYGREPEVWPWSAGASAHGFFNEVVGVPSISGPGVSYDGSNYHAPNEHFRMGDFVGGSKHMAAMFARM